MEVDDRKILKDALKDAPFHHRKKPNKNLIHDDDQDVRSQLEKRQLQSLLISRRLSHNPDNEQGSESSSINSSWLMNVANSMAFRRPSLASQRSLNMQQQEGRRRTISSSSNIVKI